MKTTNKNLRFEKLLTEVEEHLQKGDSSGAAHFLKEAKDANIPRALRCRFAKNCRRVALPELAVKILNPIVRRSGRKLSDATDEEKAEYAASLVKIGAPEEARELLSQINSNALPEVLLYEAFAHISIWNYPSAIPCLYKYIASDKLSDFQREIGRANLAASLVHEKDPRAGEVLAELKKNCEKGNYRILLGNAHSLLAEHFLYLKDWNKCEEHLQKASTFFDGTKSMEGMFIRKWRAVLALYQDASTVHFKLLEAVRNEAIRVKHWETVRSCDYYAALFGRDRKLFSHVYFGTPYDNFKQEMLKEFAEPVSLSQSLDWNFTDPGKTGTKSLSFLINRNEQLSKVGLKNRQANHRLISIFTTDFYRSFRTATLHHHLYPGEFFNPHSSPLRVRKAISRLRKWLKAENIPLTVLETDGAYRLSAPVGVCLNVPREKRAEKDLNSLIQELNATFGTTGFKAQEAAKVLGLNPWTTIELLTRAHEDGLVQRQGKARATQYYCHSSQEQIKQSA